MEPSDDRQRATPAAETAAEWFVRFRDEQLSAAERREYLSWLQQSPQNVAEMLRVCRLYGLLRASKLRAELSRDDVLSNILDRYPPPGAPASRPLRLRRPQWKVAALLIAIALIAALGVVFQHSML